MKIGIVGTGYVAAFYATNAKQYQDIHIIGAFDTKEKLLNRFTDTYNIPAYSSYEELLETDIQLIINLTNPRSHFEVSRQALEKGKHVYSEKPLGMSMEEIDTLIKISNKNKVRIGCAPCGVLSNTANTLHQVIKDGLIGEVKLVYANYDDGMIAPHMKPWNWEVDHGAKWPAKDEFEIGCTYEHAGYFLTWLNRFFGPAKSIQAFSSTQLPDKGIEVETMAPDFSIGCITYEKGVVARVTSGLVAPEDKSLTVVGDKGLLMVKYLRNDNEPIYFRPYHVTGNQARLQQYLNRGLNLIHKLLPFPFRELKLWKKIPLLMDNPVNNAGKMKKVDFMRGVQDMVEAIEKDKPHKLTADWGRHIFEQIEMLQFPERFNYHKKMTTEFSYYE